MTPLKRYIKYLKIKYIVVYHIQAKKCDPVQQKGHFVSQVHSEIMSKTVCKIYRK